jgi:hypothetical protein
VADLKAARDLGTSGSAVLSANGRPDAFPFFRQLLPILEIEERLRKGHGIEHRHGRLFAVAGLSGAGSFGASWGNRPASAAAMVLLQTRVAGRLIQTQAGKNTAEIIDLAKPGGMLMIRSLIRSSIIACRLQTDGIHMDAGDKLGAGL